MIKPPVSIVIPTFREAKNIPVLTEKIDNVMKNARLSYEIIIVDDNSRDGIVEAVEILRNRKYPVTLKVRTNEKSLSSAVIAGFLLANGDIFVVMDADLSHPPEKIPELVSPILEGKVEFVIGSRFVPGGLALHFDFYRKLNALVARLLARPFTTVRDPMAGFFAFPSRILKANLLNPLGFKIGLELLVKCEPRGVMEIPIQFQERLYGESKLTFKQQFLYLLHLLRLFRYRYRSISEFIRFGVIGTTGVVIDLACVYAAREFLSVPFRYATIIGFVFAMTSNFFNNRIFTFQKGRDGNIYRQYMTFAAVSLSGFLVNWLISVYLYEHMAFFNSHYLIAAFMGILGGMTVNFTGSKFLVFHSGQDRLHP